MNFSEQGVLTAQYLIKIDLNDDTNNLLIFMPFAVSRYLSIEHRKINRVIRTNI